MSPTLIETIRDYLDKKEIPLYAAADAEAMNSAAPEGFRPRDMLPEARSVVIFAKPLPLSVFQTPSNNGIYSYYTCAFHTYYQATNEAVGNICLMLEDAGYAALPIPAYSPLKFHRGEPRGLISLKHAAVAAGLGKMGKNTLLIHPDEGNILRLGGLITTFHWPGDGPKEFPRLCPDNCRQCLDACPVEALSENGINIMKCMGHCIKHTMMPPAWVLSLLRRLVGRSRFLTRQMDLFTLSFFGSYGVSCFACLKACPHFPGNRKPHRPTP